MNLSIVCVTNDDGRQAGSFIKRMIRLARTLDAEFVLGLDGKAAQESDMRKFADKVVDLPAHDVPLLEKVLDIAIEACTGKYVLRLDDDEVVSSALEDWLKTGAYQNGGLFAFPRVYMWGDDQHVLANEGMWPDLQTRLGLKSLMFGVNSIHAGNPNGTGLVVPYALEHHKLLVKSYAERKQIADRYEAVKPGAGYSFTYGRYNTPEDIYGELIVKPYTDGNYAQ